MAYGRDTTEGGGGGTKRVGGGGASFPFLAFPGDTAEGGEDEDAEEGEEAAAVECKGKAT